jgi:hypothetical protein
MRKVTNLVGQQFNRLTVQRRSGRDKRGKVLWDCACSCGLRVKVRGESLRSGNTQSCRCLQREVRSENGRASGSALVKHGPLY